MGVNRTTKSKDLKDHIVESTKASIVEESGETNTYDVNQGEVHGDVQLSEDQGVGKAVIVRTFFFKANPQAFREYTPSKQELFSAHATQIQAQLAEDGLKPMPEISPKLVIGKTKTHYKIIVGAEPMAGQLLHQRPDTLMNLANNLKK
jgi:hypothetical protein